jgi:hypothetical protein
MTMKRLHPWAAPLAYALAAVFVALVVGVALMGFGVSEGGWLALLAALVGACLIPLFWLTMHARHPAEPRRWPFHR